MKHLILFILIVSTLFFTAEACLAHCDTKDGPVVKAAEKALSTGNVNLVLVWVQPKDEAAIKEAFQKTLELRKTSPAVQKAVDDYFFETLVRVHRAGEGAPYTGLKEAGEVEVPIAAADRAITTGSSNEMIKMIRDLTQKGLLEKYNDVMSKKNYNPNDLEAGRKYVESYVVFIHYVEGIYSASLKGEHHGAGEESISEEHATISHHEAVTRENEATHPNERVIHYLMLGSTLLVLIMIVVLFFKRS
jgi:hypothetical protein